MKESKKNKSYLSILFLILNIGILYYLVATDEELRGSAAGLNQFNIYIIAAASAFMLTYILFDVIKTYMLIRFYTGRRLFLLSIKVSILGKYYDGITPFATGGQPFQIYTLTKSDISGVHASGVILIKYFIYQAVFFVYGILSLIMNIIYRISFSPFYYILFIVSLAVNFLMPYTVYYLATHKHTTGRILNFFINIGYKLHIIKDKQNTSDKLHDTVSKFSEAFNQLKKDKRKVFHLILLSFIEIAFFILIPFVIYVSYSPGIITSPDLLGIMSKFLCSYLFVYFVMTVFPLPGGSGAAEFGFKWLLAGYFLGGTVSIVIIIWRAVTYYLPLILGVFIIIFNTFKKLKNRY